MSRRGWTSKRSHVRQLWRYAFNQVSAMRVRTALLRLGTACLSCSWYGDGGRFRDEGDSSHLAYALVKTKE